MEPIETNLYFIRNVGCDDVTGGLFYLNDEELYFLISLFYNLNKNSQYCCMPKIYIAKAPEEMFELLTDGELKNKDELGMHDVFYNQFGTPFTWAKGHTESELNFIDYKEYIKEKDNER